MAGTHKKNAGFVLMELQGERVQDKYDAPSGRSYGFNDDYQEWVHPTDVNYLRAAYGIQRVPWTGGTE